MSEHIKMNPWILPSSPLLRRRIGKTGEEANELGAVCSRILIQGLDEIDPSSGKPNRRRLEEESADVIAQIRKNMQRLGLDADFIKQRVSEKCKRMDEWESLYPAEEPEA